MLRISIYILRIYADLYTCVVNETEWRRCVSNSSLRCCEHLEDVSSIKALLKGLSLHSSVFSDKVRDVSSNSFWSSFEADIMIKVVALLRNQNGGGAARTLYLHNNTSASS